MCEPVPILEPFNQLARYEALMDVVGSRMINRAFAKYEVSREHIELILEAAPHAPSGANSLPMYRDESKID